MMAKVVEDIIGLHTTYKPNKLFNSPLITLGARRGRETERSSVFRAWYFSLNNLTNRKYQTKTNLLKTPDPNQDLVSLWVEQTS